MNVSDVWRGVGKVICETFGSEYLLSLKKAKLLIENLLNQRRLRAGMLEALLA